MKSKIKDILFLLSPKERAHLVLLCLFMVLNALLEVTGIASIAPLVAVITNPESMRTVPILQAIYNHFDFTSYSQFCTFFGLLVLLVLFLSNSVMLLTNYFSFRFANNREYSIGSRLFKTYLQQPYSFFLERNSSELLRNVFNEIAYVVSNVIMQTLVFISRTISAVAIIGFIFFVNPQVTLIVGGLFLFAYGLIFVFIKPILYQFGKRNVSYTEEKLRTISDAFRVIKDIKMMSAESVFLDKFDRAANSYANVRTKSDIATSAPRYIIEFFAMTALIVTIIFIVSNNKDANHILPVLGIYAFAGYRLMPAMQQIFNALSKIQFSSHSLNIIKTELSSLYSETKDDENQVLHNIPFHQNISMKDVSFAYQNKENILSNFNISINKGEKIGIIGRSGEGKSTVIDILAGLHPAQEGGVYVDGQLLTLSSLKSWRTHIAYVSQNTYLLDESIDMNITLSRRNEKIDPDLLKRAKEIALVNDFLDETTLDKKYTVGENGQRLSGGQRQRVGIARALYRMADILILDEATSALDAYTEEKLLKNIVALEGKTVIFITHRVETLKFCDKIYVIEAGAIADEGKYSHLLENSRTFQSLVKSQEN